MKTYSFFTLMLVLAFTTSCFTNSKEELGSELNTEKSDIGCFSRKTKTLEFNLYSNQGDNLKIKSFTPSGKHCITRCKLWRGVKDQAESEFHQELSIEAGLKNSERVAKWFEQKLNGGQAVGISNHNKELPKELNFAFTGKLILDYEDNEFELDFVFGQSGKELDKNWWYGGMEIERNTSDRGTIKPYAVLTNKNKDITLTIEFVMSPLIINQLGIKIRK